MTSLATRIGVGLIPLFALSGCFETAEDLERKPELVDKIVEMSAEICDTDSKHIPFMMEYEDRLRAVLRNNTANSLDFLIEENIAVCLDDRLPEANHLFTKDVRALYYPAQGEEGKRVLALSDDGEYPEQIVQQMISGFFLNYTSGSLEYTDSVQYGYKNTFGNRGPLWEEAEEFFNFRNVAELSNPPFPPVVEEVVEEIPSDVKEEAIDAAGQAVEEIGEAIGVEPQHSELDGPG